MRTITNHRDVVADAERGLTATFRNWHLTVVGLMAAAISFWLFCLVYPWAFGFPAAAFGGYASYTAIATLLGVSVRGGYVSAPIPVSPRLPFLSIGRTRIAMTALIDVTALGGFMGYESVGLSTRDGQIHVLFANREQRLAFFDAVKAQSPATRICKAYA